LFIKPFKERKDVIASATTDVSDLIQLILVMGVHLSNDDGDRDRLALALLLLQLITVLIIVVVLFMDALSTSKEVLRKLFLRARKMKEEGNNKVDAKFTRKSHVIVPLLPQKIAPLDLQPTSEPSAHMVSMTPNCDEDLDRDFLMASTQICMLMGRRDLTLRQKVQTLHSWWTAVCVRHGLADPIPLDEPGSWLRDDGRDANVDRLTPLQTAEKQSEHLLGFPTPEDDGQRKLQVLARLIKYRYILLLREQEIPSRSLSMISSRPVSMINPLTDCVPPFSPPANSTERAQRFLAPLLAPGAQYSSSVRMHPVRLPSLVRPALPSTQRDDLT
jgi:hypothetical protein